jgi:hypothetical protein
MSYLNFEQKGYFHALLCRLEWAIDEDKWPEATEVALEAAKFVETNRNGFEMTQEESYRHQLRCEIEELESKRDALLKEFHS